MLSIEDLHVETGGAEIIRGLNLVINPGQAHFLFGPNGAGKSTLIGAIMGFKRYRITRGKIFFKGEDITSMSVSERARKGIGIAYQRPPVVRGVSLGDIMTISGRGREMDVAAMAEAMNLGTFLGRDVNYGFSGGETRRSELLQLQAQEPDLVLFDEPDSGVDLESIALVGQAINLLLEKGNHQETGHSRSFAKSHRQKAGLIISHTGYLLDYVAGDVGHVMMDGRLSCTGHNPRELLECIRKAGYRECGQCLENIEQV